jgi:ATP-dependent RNA helicase RhlE
VSRSGTVAPRAEQRVYRVPQAEKPSLLLALLAEDDLSTLVFTRTKHRTDKVAHMLERAGHRVSRLHSNRSQSQRQQALEGSRKGSSGSWSRPTSPRGASTSRRSATW